MAVFVYPPQVTYLHTKIEGGLIFFISNFASLSRRIALKKIQDFCSRDMESCHLAAARRVKLWSLNANLFFKEPQQ